MPPVSATYRGSPSGVHVMHTFKLRLSLEPEDKLNVQTSKEVEYARFGKSRARKRLEDLLCRSKASDGAQYCSRVRVSARTLRGHGWGCLCVSWARRGRPSHS